MSDRYVELRIAADVTDEVLSAAIQCAEAVENYDDNGRPHIEWEDAYDLLERLEGFFVVEMGSPADRKIRRHVQAQLAEVF